MTGGLTILLVDDDDVDAYLIRELLEAVLGEGKFVLRRAALIRDISRALAGGGVDLVLIDLNLPDGRGFDNVARVRAVAPDVPVIVLSGSEDPSRRADSLRAGAQAYLSKVRTEPAELARAIDGALASRSAGVPQ